MKDGRLKKILTFDYNAISLPVIAGYMALYFVLPDFLGSAILGLLLLGLFTGVCFLQFVFIKKCKVDNLGKIHWIVLGFTIAVLLNILRNLEYDRVIFYYAIILVIGNALFWMSSPMEGKTLKITKWVVIAVGLLFAAFNTLTCISPDLGKKLASLLMQGTSEKHTHKLIYEGYGFTFGQDIGMTAHLMAMSLALVWFGLDKGNWKTHFPMIFLLAFGFFALQRRSEPLVWLFGILIMTVVSILKYRKLGIPQATRIKKYAVGAACIALAFVLCLFISPNSRFSLNKYIQTSPPSTSVDSSDSIEDSVGEEPDDEITPDGPTFDAEAFSNGRFKLWRLAWREFKKAPVFGNGWGSFAKVAPETGNMRANNVHMVYLQLLCETGIVGFVLIGSVFVSIFIFLVQGIVKAKEEKTAKRYIVALCLLLCMLGMGLLNNPLYDPYWIQTLQMLLFGAFVGKKQAAAQIEAPPQEEISQSE